MSNGFNGLLLGAPPGGAELTGAELNDRLVGRGGNDTLNGLDGHDTLIGGLGADMLNGGAGDDLIQNAAGNDTLTTGTGRDVIRVAENIIATDASPGLRTVATAEEDVVTDFDLALDRFVFDATAFNIFGRPSFFNGLAADLPASGVNAIVLRDLDNDGDPATAFNAGAAASLIAGQVDAAGAGFFVYFNSALGVNRLVYSADLNDATADLQVIARFSDMTGQAGIDALADFSAGNLRFLREQPPLPGQLVGGAGNDRLTGTANNDIITGNGGNDTIRAGDGADQVAAGEGNDIINLGAGNDTLDAGAGNDVIVNARGNDRLTTGTGNDLIRIAENIIAVDATPGVRSTTSAEEETITDFDLSADRFAFDASAFGIAGPLSFFNGLAAALPASGADVIVLQDADSDNNPATAFTAGAAATLIADRVDGAGAGFFVYFNSLLNVNRLVYSADLSDRRADLQIIARFTDATGLAAIDKLPSFAAANFDFF